MTALHALRRTHAAAAALAALVAAGAWHLRAPATAHAQQNAHRFIWAGTIDDDGGGTVRALSGGGVHRMPEPFTFSHHVHVDFRYVQEFRPDGSVEWTSRRISWDVHGVHDEAGGRIGTNMIIAAALIEGFTFFGLVICKAATDFLAK